MAYDLLRPCNVKMTCFLPKTEPVSPQDLSILHKLVSPRGRPVQLAPSLGTKPICICRYYMAELLLPLIAFLLPLIAAAIN